MARSNNIEWTLNDAGITDRSSIINIHETCCKMFCSNAGGSPEANSTSSRTHAATSPCSSPPGISRPDVFAQLIFQGKTSAVERWSPRPTRRAIGRRRRRPSQPPLTWLDTTVMNPDGSSAPWICFVDVSWLVFVPPNTTAGCQPLDGAFMRPFRTAGPIFHTLHWSGNPTPSRRRCQHHPQHCWHAQLHHALDPRRGAGHCDDAS